MPDERTRTRRDKAPVTARPFQIRGRFLTAIALRVEDVPLDDAFFTALDEQLENTPQLLAEAPVLLDFEAVAETLRAGHIRELVEKLRARKLMVFATQNASPTQQAIAGELGLIPVSMGRDAPLPQAKKSRADRLLPPDNKLIATPIRSGQTVVAERGDLTIVGSVSSGAELAAAGSIHVYGTMRGRAMAGVHGDETARIFCQNQNAELLAIAGLYRTSESIGDELRNRSVQVFLDKDKLCMEALG
ncbi:Septum site-determining protein MinC [Marinibacterium anthonyi]|nr:Septum site-determining protein MinC [Marinibacterium anthonyi]